MLKFNKSFNLTFFFVLLLLFPAALISGPLIPEIISFILIIFFFKKIKSNYLFLKNKYFIFFTCFYIYFLTLSIFTNSISNIFTDHFFYFRFFCFSSAIYFLLNENNKLLKYFSISIVITITILILDVFIQYIFGKNLIGMEIMTVNRYSGLFGSELVLGSYVSRMFPFVFGLIYIYKDDYKYGNLILYFFTLISCLSVFISGERTAVGLLAISLFFIIIKKDNRKFSIILLLILAISLSSLFYFNKSLRYRIIIEPFHQMSMLGNNILDKYSDVATPYEPENLYQFFIFSSHHHSHYVTALNMFKKNIIFGVGPEKFRDNCRLINYSSGQDPCSTHPHNILMQIMSETGLVGLIFFLLIFTFVIIEVFKRINQRKLNSLLDLEYYILLSFLINLWPFLPSGNIFNNWLSYIFYLPLGFYFYIKNFKYESI